MFSGARTTLLGVGTGTSVRCDGEAEASELLADDMVAVAAGMGVIGGGSVLGRVESVESYNYGNWTDWPESSKMSSSSTRRDTLMNVGEGGTRRAD